MLSILVQLAHTWLHLPSPENSPKLWHLPMPKPGTSSLHGCSTPYNLHTTKQNGLKLLSQTFKALIKFKTMQCILNHSFYGLPKSTKKKTQQAYPIKQPWDGHPLSNRKETKALLECCVTSDFAIIIMKVFVRRCRQQLCNSSQARDNSRSEKVTSTAVIFPFLYKRRQVEVYLVYSKIQIKPKFKSRA